MQAILRQGLLISEAFSLLPVGNRMKIVDNLSSQESFLVPPYAVVWILTSSPASVIKLTPNESMNKLIVLVERCETAK